MTNDNFSQPKRTVQRRTWVLGRCNQCGFGALEPLDGQPLGPAVAGIRIAIPSCHAHESAETVLARLDAIHVRAGGTPDRLAEIVDELQGGAT